MILSGLSCLVLSCKEEHLLDQYYKVHLEQLLCLHSSSPRPLVFLVAGRLPLVAQLHLRMLSLLGQLCRLHEGLNVLAHFLKFSFSSSLANSKSWFWKVRNLCQQYGLPHPIEWLKSQPSKEEVKRR